MSFTTAGVIELKAYLGKLAHTPVIAWEELGECAVELRDLARHMAPYDYGDLQRAISFMPIGSTQRNEKGHFIKGLSSYKIFVSDRTNTADPKKIKAGITKVVDYAWEVENHMGYEGHEVKGYMPTEDSVKRGESFGVISGGRFLERAVEAYESKFYNRMASAVFRYINSL